MSQAISEKARKEREQKYVAEIEALQKRLDEEKQEKIRANKEIEELSHKLDEALYQNVDPEEVASLRSQLQILLDNKTDIERQILQLQYNNKRLEEEKKTIEKTILEMQYEASQNSEQKAKIEDLQTQYANIEEELAKLQSDNVILSKQLQESEEKRISFQQDMEVIGSKNADISLLDELRAELIKAQKSRDESEKRFEQITNELKEAQTKLFVTKSEIDQSLQEYNELQAGINQLKKKGNTIQQEIKCLKEKRLAFAGPLCPRCNAPLMIRNGRNGEFLGCTSYRRVGTGCRFTRDLQYGEKELFDEILVVKNKEDILWEKFNTNKAVVEKAERDRKNIFKQKYFKTNNVEHVVYEAYPYSLSESSPIAYLFQSLGIPNAIFKEKESLKLNYFSRFLATFMLPKTTVENPDKTLFSLTLRLLNRGIVTPINRIIDEKLKSKFDVKNFGRIQSLFEYVEYEKPENAYDSKYEKEFAEYYLPKVLGKNWASFTIPQAGLDLLLPERKEEFFNQRVDFYVSKNGKQIIIEIDGNEHDNSRVHDSVRDNALIKHGYQVCRFTNDQVKNHAEEIIDVLNSIIGVIRNREINTEIDDKYLVAAKLEHQFAITIVKALEQGYIDKNTNLTVEGSKIIFSDAELKYILALAVEEVETILRQYAIIYDVNFKINLSDEAKEEVCICLGDLKNWHENRIILRDCYVPYNFLCDIEQFDPSIKPVNCDIEAVEYFLNYIYGYERFRDGQFSAVERLMLRRDSVILLPTGAGKSIIYQLSSYIAPGITIIISPLKSLMDDQIINLEFKAGINNAIAIMSHSGKSSEDIRETQLKAMIHNSLSMIYIAPERLQIPSFRENIAGLMRNNFVYTVAIDEAHCVSEWGHDFRPSYLNIANSIRQLFRKNDFLPTIIALTGTASEHVLKDVQKSLEISGDDSMIMPSSFDRRELNFSVLSCSVSDKGINIANIIKNKIPGQLGISYEDFVKLDDDKTKAGIVFTPNATSKRMSSYDALGMSYNLGNLLPEMGISCYFSKTPEAYDDNDWSATIRKNADDFKRNKINMLVATKAFGMGIDKSNVRFIIHDGIPSSLEQYYQEAGRAGRGRDDSYCCIVFSNDEAKTFEPLLSADIDLEQVQKNFKEAGFIEDDLSKILFFHTESYKGVNEECRYVDDILEKIPEGKFIEGYRFVVANTRLEDKTLKEWQKAMIRLINLGVFKDYTYDYRREFSVVCGTLKKEIISEQYIQFIRDDNVQRAEEAKNAVKSIKETGYAYVRIIIKMLIEYVYDSIEKSRRNAARLMYQTVKEAASKNESEQDKFLRSAILSYFSIEGKENELSEILSAPNAGIHLVKRVINISSGPRLTNSDKEKYRDLNYRVGRILESTPDQPALLLIRSICEMYLKHVDQKQVINDIIIAIKYSQKRYMVNKEVLTDELAELMRHILPFNKSIFFALMDKFSDVDIDKDSIMKKMIDKSSGNSISQSLLLLLYTHDKIQQLDYIFE